ncbi:hypothetical protein MHBO_004206 [Bonamia ostreae]|uniref:Large ribosomal subunit protein eL24-related N-terminal domain-containing protein n=1 Tax=Bonamia ostreae TaxID=126728 RepID=A0ABV2ASN7_9EUKA
MVVKTNTCFYSEHIVHPGHGFTFFRRDGKSLFFESKKAFNIYSNGTKPTKITWTTAWRRLNKKVTTTTTNRKKRTKNTKVIRPIEGMSLEDIIKRKEEKQEFRKAAREEQKREIKERNRKQMEEKKKERIAGGNKAQFEKNRSRNTNTRQFNKARR